MLMQQHVAMTTSVFDCVQMLTGLTRRRDRHVTRHVAQTLCGPQVVGWEVGEIFPERAEVCSSLDP